MDKKTPDIKAMIEKLTDSISKNDSLKAQFQKDPIKAVEKVLGVDLPEDVVQQIITAVKGKITLDKVSGAADALKKLF
jgi:hypothetical protein